MIGDDEFQVQPACFFGLRRHTANAAIDGDDGLNAAAIARKSGQRVVLLRP